jgi:large conductance mechanosensitive channel
MGFFKEFREFAVRGNVADMAVGVIVGAAFGKIVSSMVDDVFMPPLGLAIGGVDFSQLAITLKPAEGAVEAVTLNYGNFLQTIFDFAIVAFVIFLAIRLLNRLRKEDAETPAPPAAPPPQEQLLTEIRDLLKARG